MKFSFETPAAGAEGVVGDERRKGSPPPSPLLPSVSELGRNENESYSGGRER